MYAVYRVREVTGANIGTYAAKNEKHAIQLAQQDQYITAATFRRGQPAIELKGLTAVMIKDKKGDAV